LFRLLLILGGQAVGAVLQQVVMTQLTKIISGAVGGVAGGTLLGTLLGGATGADPAAGEALGGLLGDAIGGAGGGAIYRDRRRRHEGDEQVTPQPNLGPADKRTLNLKKPSASESKGLFQPSSNGRLAAHGTERFYLSPTRVLEKRVAILIWAEQQEDKK
jgi:hypothetical protein